MPSSTSTTLGVAARADALASCTVEGHRLRCGALNVLENRQDPGRSIALHYAVAHARESTDKPPVVLLAGGPGQAGIAVYGALLPLLAPLRAEHDLILVDQRGTGGSNRLDCPDSSSQLADSDLADMLSVDIDAERVLACRAGLAGDPTLYTTPHAVADLAEMLDALGHRQVHLVAGSYGTRVALAFAHAHPERVRTMTLDGVVPADMKIPLSFVADGQRALDRLFDDCAADPRCHAAFGDLRGKLARLLEQFDNEGRPVLVKHPRTGEQIDLLVQSDALVQGLRGLLYVPELAALLPLAIEAAHNGDFAPFVAQTLMMGEGVESDFSQGMHYSVLCAEDAPLITDAELEREAEQSFLGSAMIDHVRRTCELWNVPALEASERSPVHSDVPTLLLSGALDPATPARWAERAAQTLSRHRSVVVPGAAHGTLTLPCVTEFVAEFVDSEDPEGLDASCVESRRRPPFFIDFAGPSMAATQHGPEASP